MAVVLLTSRPDRTNRLLLTFSGDLDSDTFEVGTGSLVAADAGLVPGFVGYYAVALHPEQLWAVFDGAFRHIGLVLTYAGMLDAVGDPVAGAAGFTGMEPSSPVRFAYDRRLKIDLATSATAGGDLGLLMGDSLVREQVIRLHSWHPGELMADKSFGVAPEPQALLTTRNLTEYRRQSERATQQLPGVQAASTSVILDAGNEVLRTRIAVKTDQTQLEVTTERLLGR